MATRTEVKLLDDIDGSDADTTVEFGMDSVQYTIDLNAGHAAALRAALEPFIAKARKVHRPAGRGVPAANQAGNRTFAQRRDENQKIREWARSQGREIAERGRVPAAVVQAYRLATAA